LAELKTDTQKVEFYNKKIEELRAKAEETKDLSKIAADLVMGDARSNIFPPFGFINFIKTPDIDEKGIEKLAEQTIKGTAPYIDRLEKSAPNILEKYGIQEEKEFLDSKANTELNSITKTDFKTIKVGIEDKEDGEADFENKSLEKLSGPDLQSILDTSILKFLKEIGVKREKESEDNLIISKGESVIKSLETPVIKKEEPKKENPANLTPPVAENKKNETPVTAENKSSGSTEKIVGGAQEQKNSGDKNTSVTNQNVVEKTQTNVTNNISSPNTTSVSNNVVSSTTPLKNTVQSSTAENKNSIQKPINTNDAVETPEKIKDNKTTPSIENKEDKNPEDLISDIISGKKVTPKEGGKNKEEKESKSSIQTNEITSLISKELGSSDIDKMLDEIFGPEKKPSAPVATTPSIVDKAQTPVATTAPAASTEAGNTPAASTTTTTPSIVDKAQTPVATTAPAASTEAGNTSGAGETMSGYEKWLESQGESGTSISSPVDKAQTPVATTPAETGNTPAASTTTTTPSIIDKAQTPVANNNSEPSNPDLSEEIVRSQKQKSKMEDAAIDAMLTSKSGAKISGSQEKTENSSTNSSIVDKTQTPVAITSPAASTEAGNTPAASTTTTPSIVDKAQTSVEKMQNSEILPKETQSESTANLIPEANPLSLIESFTNPEGGLSKDLTGGISNIAQSVNNTNPLQSKISETKNQVSATVSGIAKTVSESPVEIKNKSVAPTQNQTESTNNITENKTQDEQENSSTNSANSENPGNQQENPQDPNNKTNETKPGSDDKKDNSEMMNGQILQVMREILKTLQGPLITTESTPRFH
jgi:hypothetical protein